MSDHAPLAPSFAPVWGNCSGAPMACAPIPNVDSDASRAGTAGHWVFAEVAVNIRDNRDAPRSCAGLVGAVCPENGVVIDEEMAEGAQVMVDEVFAVAEAYGLVHALLIEHRVHMPAIHPVHNWGRLDAALVVSDHHGPRKIYAWDYKGGHVEKRAAGNLQLIDYLNGVAFQAGVQDDQHVAYSLRIVQPFAYNNRGPVDTDDGMLSDLRGFVNKLARNADLAFTNPTLTAGQHCADCPANGVCSAAKKYGYLLADLTERPYDMDRMTPAELATERAILTRAMSAAKERLKTIEDMLTEGLKNGASGTGLTLEAGYGRTKWADGVAVPIAIAQQFGFDIRKEEALTPKQAIQAAPAKVRAYFEQTIKQHTKTPMSGMKLIDAADSKTARAFKRK